MTSKREWKRMYKEAEQENGQIWAAYYDTGQALTEARDIIDKLKASINKDVDVLNRYADEMERAADVITRQSDEIKRLKRQVEGLQRVNGNLLEEHPPIVGEESDKLGEQCNSTDIDNCAEHGYGGTNDRSNDN